MNKKIFRSFWLLCLALTLSLACLSGAGQQIEGVRETIESGVDKGRGAIETAQSYATQGAALIATGQVFATEQAPLIETAKAFATQGGPEMLETIQSAATELAFGEAPSDIPIIDQSQIENLVASNLLVTFTANMPYDEVVNYYKQNMPLNGWQEVPGGRVETDLSSWLPYEKTDRKATILITPSGDQSFIVITIENK